MFLMKVTADKLRNFKYAITMSLMKSWAFQLYSKWQIKQSDCKGRRLIILSDFNSWKTALAIQQTSLAFN